MTEECPSTSSTEPWVSRFQSCLAAISQADLVLIGRNYDRRKKFRNRKPPSLKEQALTIVRKLVRYEHKTRYELLNDMIILLKVIEKIPDE